jgi:hypothetical protein
MIKNRIGDVNLAKIAKNRERTMIIMGGVSQMNKRNYAGVSVG